MARTFSDVLLEAQELSKLEYSEYSIPDLISFIKEAIKIAQAIDPDPRTNTCLDQIIKTQKNELALAKEKGLSQEEREPLYNEALSNFITDLGFCPEQSK